MGTLARVCSPVEALRFDRFIVHTGQRLLLADGQPLRLGGRALEILLVLLEHAGAVVDKQTLLARVWPGSVVEEINLRVHIAALRRALGDGFIVNLPGQGYCFVAPVRREGQAPVLPANNLPTRLSRIIGRDEELAALALLLAQRRLVTLTGPVGVGKSSLGLAAAEAQAKRWRDGVWLLDFAQAHCADEAMAGLLRDQGLQPRSDCPLGGLPGHLLQRQALLVLDHCEAQPKASRRLVDALLALAPGVSLLVIGREPLRVRGETLLPVSPLAVPPGSDAHSVEQFMSYAAVRLFVTCAQARQPDFQLRQQDLKTVWDICRRLDGLPLALELAAAQIDVFALVGLRAQLNEGLQVLNRGRRTAEARHQSLKAALDWSFQRLSDAEQQVLQCLVTLGRGFSLEQAVAHAAAAGLGPLVTVRAVEQLAAKSLLTVEHGLARYRVLNSTRWYLGQVRQSVPA
ncbi:ATP-binding protein [Pseudomonas putida]|uniref:HTH-type transcriptional regulator n=1 Tax=Pseudomonas putida TaxID=303 RepID=A0A1Q9R1K0_PSEPU|nr:helix-turn-helix transcriptional regulator [Pseudomonas putida]OLS61276.1 putative HTH-type transcriptional regulator [Pseudomonas putida]